MSDSEKNPKYVTDPLCKARMDTLEEKIKAIKTAVYSVGATITIILTIVNVIMYLIGR